MKKWISLIFLFLPVCASNREHANHVHMQEHRAKVGQSNILRSHLRTPSKLAAEPQRSAAREKTLAKILLNKALQRPHEPAREQAIALIRMQIELSHQPGPTLWESLKQCSIM